MKKWKVVWDDYQYFIAVDETPEKITYIPMNYLDYAQKICERHNAEIEAQCSEQSGEEVPPPTEKEAPRTIIKVRYHSDTPPLDFIDGVSDWIDLYTSENVVLSKGDSFLIPLGVSIELPKGYEANIVPRSSTFMKYGILQTNSYGVIDNTYCGDDDILKFPAYATRDCTIPKSTRICQFRLNKTMSSEMGDIVFVPVSHLTGQSRGGFGSTGE